MLVAQLDGGCIRNPGGPAAAACLIITIEGNEIHRASKFLEAGPKMTNNVAEFEGLNLIFDWLLQQNYGQRIHIVSDSQILINRMNGKLRKPPAGHFAKIAIACVNLNSVLRKVHTISYEWKPRMHNEICDEMCSREMKSHKEKSKVPSYMNDHKGYRYGTEII